MDRNQKKGCAHRTIGLEADNEYSCELVDELGEEVEAAVRQSVVRFLAANRRNIEVSTKEKVATASYGGGMMDMAMLVRHALGRWALEQLLIELENWVEEDEEEDEKPGVKSATMTLARAEISSETAGESAEHIGSWQTEKESARERRHDPMYA